MYRYVRSLAPLFLALSLLLSGCGKDKAEKNSQAKEAPPVPAKFAGTLTEAMVLAAGDVASAKGEWEAEFARLVERLGPPTLVEGTTHYWAASGAETCSVLRVNKDRGADYFDSANATADRIGSVSKPQTVRNSEEPSAWDACLRATGSIAAAASPPPATGLASVADFRKGIAEAPDAWVHQSISVEGTFGGASTTPAEGGGPDAVSLKILGAGGESIWCALVSGATAPTIAPDSAVKVTGRASATGGGGLVDCALLGGS